MEGGEGRTPQARKRGFRSGRRAALFYKYRKVRLQIPVPGTGMIGSQ
jgi:hypothetical protein